LVECHWGKATLARMTFAGSS